MAGLGSEGKNTHERSSATRQHDLLHNLDVKKRMNVVPCAQLTTCLPIQQKGGQQLRGAMINLGIRFLVLCIENVPHSSPFIKT